MIERAEFGRTGHLSSRTIFGAAALWTATQDHADALLQVLLEFGVNHIDVAADYGDAELRVGPWMAEHRNDFFLATKTAKRSGGEARASLERSLERLRVDHVDHIQLHNLVEEDEWETVHGPGGALEALLRARDEGLTRFIGVTGHGTRIARMHLRSLERFDYDSVLLPYNFTMLAGHGYRADAEELLDVCAGRGIAVQAIKSAARRRWPDDPHNTEGPRNSWYQPLEDPGAIERAVRFVLSRPQLFLVTPGDYRILRTVLEAASVPATAPSEDEMAADVERFAITPLFEDPSLERI